MIFLSSEIVVVKNDLYTSGSSMESIGGPQLGIISNLLNRGYYTGVRGRVIIPILQMKKMMPWKLPKVFGSQQSGQGRPHTPHPQASVFTVPIALLCQYCRQEGDRLLPIHPVSTHLWRHSWGKWPANIPVPESANTLAPVKGKLRCMELSLLISWPWDRVILLDYPNGPSVITSPYKWKREAG